MKHVTAALMMILLIALPQFALSNDNEDTGLTSMFETGLGIGAVTINGELYNQIAFRPTFTIGKLSMGLDLAVYINGEGKISKHNWDDFEDYLNVLYFLSWASKYDPFYFRIGGLDQVTFVNGISIDRYTNMLEYPVKKRFGTEIALSNRKKEDRGIALGFYGFIADWTELGGGSYMPGLLGGRFALGGFLEFGLSAVADLNPFNAFKEDIDGDGYADLMDMYPNNPDYYVDTDGDGIPDRADIDVNGNNLWEYTPVPGLTHDIIETYIAPMFPTYDGYECIDTVQTLYIPTIDTLMKEHPTVFSASADITIPVFRSSGFSLEIYSVAAILGYLETGTRLIDFTKDDVFIGTSPLGLGFTISNFLTAKLEYRWAQENFQYGFFDKNYDLNRVYFIQDDNQRFVAKTKFDQLLAMQLPKSQGFYGSVGINIMNFFTLDCSYMNMVSGGGNVLQTFQIEASVPPDAIPLVSEITGYYHRNNDPNPWDFKHPSERTVMGASIGMDLGGGVSIVYNYMRTFRDMNGDGVIMPKEEAVTIMNVETGFNF
ncbi:MAG: hypothetical protein PHT46_05640 [Candidatus Marinimicrobia bacterium]|jgi:hypothetical protein|nr:hypothetical protein [Candidatus Neomarinimicrobiota bacterium]MDD5710321.1 hypothetical protein [Candidatus Neomarinimicrobiota bacterium]MDX9778451.1 hypothetical protein [bacterium]